jgi:hypothetical protein
LRYDERYWDGSHWTKQVASAGQRSSDPDSPPLARPINEVPSDRADAAAPEQESAGDGWWIAADGRWYAPSLHPTRAGWWVASDGNWYPPSVHPARSAKTPLPPRLDRLSAVWLLALAAGGTVVGFLPAMNSPMDERGCPTDASWTPAGFGLWALVLVAAGIGAAVFFKQSERLKTRVLVGLLGSAVGPVMVWVLSGNPCWA